MAGKLQCERHRAEVGWQCTACNRLLCPDCAATKVMHPTTVVACTYCGELAQPVEPEKAARASLWSQLPGAFLYPFTTYGVALWLGLVVIDAVTFSFGFMRIVALLIRLTGVGLTAGGLFGLIRATSAGTEAVVAYHDLTSSVISPLLRFVTVLAPFWVGAVVALFTGSTALMVFSCVLGLFWVPVAIIGAAAGAEPLALLNPLRILGVSALLGRDFVVYAAGLLVALVVVALGLMVEFSISAPFLGLVVGLVIRLYALVSAARLAGLVLREHGELFGHDTSLRAAQHAATLPEPRGVLPEPAAAAPVAHRSAPIELEPGTPARPAADRYAPIELEPEPVVAQARSRFEALEVNRDAPVPTEAAPLDLAMLPDHSEQSAQEIRKAVAAKNADQALDAFRATGLSAAEQLSPDELMWVAQAAAVRLDNESAELAFSKVSARRDAAPAVRARSKVMLARLYAERLGRKAEARALMEAVVAEFPTDAAAGFARTWLARG